MAGTAGRSQAADRQGHRGGAYRPVGRGGTTIDPGHSPAEKLNVELGWSHDSDKNTLWWQNIGASVLLTNGVRGFASAGVAEASDPLRDGTRLSGEAGVLDRPGQRESDGVPAHRRLSDGFDSRTAATWRAAASVRLTQHAGVGVGYSHYSFDETALLLGRDLDIDEVRSMAT